jgi:hypothetical protein
MDSFCRIEDPQSLDARRKTNNLSLFLRARIGRAAGKGRWRVNSASGTAGRQGSTRRRREREIVTMPQAGLLLEATTGVEPAMNASHVARQGLAALL